MIFMIFHQSLPILRKLALIEYHDIANISTERPLSLILLMKLAKEQS